MNPTPIMIRVSIADDHPLIINGLMQVLNSCEDIEVIASYPNGQQLLEGLRTTQPDVILLDMHMPDGNGDEVAPMLSQQYRKIKVIALTNQDNTYYVKTMMSHGAAGYVLKTSGADSIIEAIRTVHAGGQFIDPLLKEKLVHETLHAKNNEVPQLTRRELEILQLIASNFSSQEIADKLYLSKRTIDNHRLHLLVKLGVKNSATLIKKAMQLGFIK